MERNRGEWHRISSHQERESHKKEGKKERKLIKRTIGVRAKVFAITNPGSDCPMIPCPGRGRKRCPAGFPEPKRRQTAPVQMSQERQRSLHLLSVSSQPQPGLNKTPSKWSHGTQAPWQLGAEEIGQAAVFRAVGVPLDPDRK